MTKLYAPLPRAIAGGSGQSLPGEPARDFAVGPALAPTLPLAQSELAGLAARALAAGDGAMAAIGIAALQHGDGASTVARNLALCLAASLGKRVVLVEANHRSPSLRRSLDLAQGPGLADVLSRRVSLGAALQMVGEHRRILVLPAAATQAVPITADVFRDLLSTLFGHADAVVVDLAPVLTYRDTGLLCAALDGVALVMRAGRSRLREGEQAIRLVREAGAPVLGAVLNRRKKGLLF